MEIHVDYNPTPKDHFFVSIPLDDGSRLSFDNTIKGPRIIKQVHAGDKPFPPDAQFNSEWETIVIEHGVLKRKYSVQWIDLQKKDWLNGEIWDTAWEKPMPEDLKKKLLYYSRLISDHYNDIEKFRLEMSTFERLMKTQVWNHT